MAAIETRPRPAAACQTRRPRKTGEVATVKVLRRARWATPLLGLVVSFEPRRESDVDRAMREVWEMAGVQWSKERAILALTLSQGRRGADAHWFLDSLPAKSRYILRLFLTPKGAPVTLAVRCDTRRGTTLVVEASRDARRIPAPQPVRVRGDPRHLGWGEIDSVPPDLLADDARSVVTWTTLAGAMDSAVAALRPVAGALPDGDLVPEQPVSVGGISARGSRASYPCDRFDIPAAPSKISPSAPSSRRRA